MASTKSKSTATSPRTCSRGMWWTTLAVLVIAGAATRLYKLHEPKHVCWDETHWGKFINLYLNRTFFLENNPPFGMMMVAFFGYLGDYKGDLTFTEPGEPYINDSYISMRLGCATLGALVVPISFLIVWEMTFSLRAATLAASLILFDNGIITLSRFILLDAGLLFFVCLSIYAHAKFQNEHDRPFSAIWWFWLLTLGTLLALTTALKFVGILTVLLIGLWTVADLWNIFGDLSRPVSYTVKHFMARVLGLIVVPIMTYLFVFYIHLQILNKSDHEDAIMSSMFQTTLKGNLIYGHSPREIAYSSVLTLKNAAPLGGYLSGMEDVSYPDQDQHLMLVEVDYRAVRNKFIIKRHDQGQFFSKFNHSDPIQLVRNGDLIRLMHAVSGRHLFSNDRSAVVTEYHWQASLFVKDADRHPNDVWQLVVENAEEGEPLHTLSQRFHLVHKVGKCVLAGTKGSLSWGSEITCAPPAASLRSSWVIETMGHPRMPKEEGMNDLSSEVSFLQRFTEIHQAMSASNSGLKNRIFEFFNLPALWPFNIKGLSFSGSKNPFVYLLGNPIIWWGNIWLTNTFLVVLTTYFIKIKRNITIPPKLLMLQKQVITSCGWLYIGWLIHYIPFLLIGRVVYFHHYFPALLFSSMLSGVIIDYLIESLQMKLPKSTTKLSSYLFLLMVLCPLIFSFYLFAPISYGYTKEGPYNSSVFHLRWLGTWNL